MTDEPSPSSERTLDLAISLDNSHQAIYDELDGAGIPVEDAVAGMIRRNAENALHEILQREKYQQ